MFLALLLLIVAHVHVCLSSISGDSRVTRISVISLSIAARGVCKLVAFLEVCQSCHYLGDSLYVVWTPVGLVIVLIWPRSILARVSVADSPDKKDRFYNHSRRFRIMIRRGGLRNSLNGILTL